MKLLKNRAVAVAVLVAAIVLSSLYGLSKRPAVELPEGAPALDESLSTAWLDQYIQDDANVLSARTENTIALYSANWDEMFGGILAVVTEKSVSGDIEDAAWDWGAEIGPNGLGENDAILLIDVSAKDYRVVASGAFYDFFASQSASFVNSCMADYIQRGDYDGALTNLLGQIHLRLGSSYESSPAGVAAFSVFGTLFSVILLIIFLVVLFNILDGIRYSMWYGRYGAMPVPPVVYRPIFWWHRPGSRWFNNRRRPPTPPRGPGGPRPPMGGPPSGGHRPPGSNGPRPPMSGGPRGGSSPRPPMGGNFGSGSFGGGSRGGSFGGGSRGGSFGGSRGGGFGGPATGGHSRGGSFGGGSRGGGFGGRR